ncbi:MAG: hypothetical protein IT305_02850 [Chloroflexi bacterium]|nr:hypothetical protein [Chloroflexota bacterium]
MYPSQRDTSPDGFSMMTGDAGLLPRFARALQAVAALSVVLAATAIVAMPLRAMAADPSLTVEPMHQQANRDFRQAGPDDRAASTLLPEVRAGFDGIGKAGRWLTIRAVVASDGPPLRGELRLLVRGANGRVTVYAQDVQVASRARKLVSFLAPVAAVGSNPRLVLLNDSREVAARDVPLRVMAPSEFLVGVVSTDGLVPSGLGAIRRSGGPVVTAQLTTADLPSDPLAYQSLDALVVRNATSDQLTSAQHGALRTWIEQGGQLIVTGGPGWRRTIEGLDDLLPVEGLWTRQVNQLRAFSRYGGSDPPEGDVLITLGSPTEDARVLLVQDSIPLIVERWRGNGRVTFVGPDLALEPFRSWPAADALWQRILVGGRPPLPTLEDASLSDYALQTTLAQLLDLGLPSPGLVAAFLLAYVLVVGPVQYAVLRRLDRREWAWITFPVLATGFAAVVVVASTWLRGPDMRMAAISVVRSVPGARLAPVDTFLGVVAPERGAYDLSLSDGLPVRPIPSRSGIPTADQTLVRTGPGGPTELPSLPVEGRALAGLETRSFIPTPTPIEAKLRAANGRLEGLLRNVGPERVEDVIVLAAGEAVGLGNLGPGESRPVSLSLPTTRTTGAWQNGTPPWSVVAPSGIDGRRRAVVERVVQSRRGADGESTGGVTVLAWTRATPPRLRVNGQPADGSADRLLQQAVPIDYGEQAVVIPPGLLGRSILDGATLGRGTSSAFVARGPIVFQYDLPPGLSFSRLDRLSIHLSLAGSATRPTPVPASRPVPTSMAIGSPSPTPGSTSNLGLAASATPGIVLPGVATPSAPARVSVYRWADRVWVEVTAISAGVADVPFGSAYLDGGSLRVRLEPQGSEVTVNQLDVSLAGVRE